MNRTQRPLFGVTSAACLSRWLWCKRALAAGAGPRFAMIVHHTDGEREWAYDRKSPVGRLDQALDKAPKHGWFVVDMKRDWKVC
jgi:hypothetical protein